MKARIDLQLHLDVRDLIALSQYLSGYYSPPSFGGGQSGIDADRALAAVVLQLREQMEIRK